jgi:lipopolysaccharide export system permease protein
VKKIHLLLLKSFIRPFIVTFMIVMFVLLMLFLFKYIDDLIGKGFEWYTILQLMMYASATNVAMALPLSVLLSSIMTYGSLGENYELVAIKAAGISLRRAMYPMIVVVTILSIAAFIFSDNMLPIANKKYYSLLYDVRQQKSASLLPEDEFSNSFQGQGYSIRVSKKDPDGQTLHGVMIYTKDAADNNLNVLIAKEGRMYKTPDNQFLVLKLMDGIRYDETPGETAVMRQRFTRFRFKETEQKFDLSFMKLKRTDENLFRSAAQMMDLKQLKFMSDSTTRQNDSARALNYKLITPYIKYFSVPKKSASGIKYAPFKGKTSLDGLAISQKLSAITNAANEARTAHDVIKNRADFYKDADKTIRKYAVEYQKKFTLSAACVALFLIGAPLGAIIRKGGLGMPVVVSVIFFLIYYIISTIGEKSVKDGDISPFIGMWIAILVLTPIGIFLSYKAANDSVLFDMEAYKRFFNKLIRRKE